MIVLGCQSLSNTDTGSNNSALTPEPTQLPSRTPTPLAATPTLTAATTAEDGSLILTFWTVEQVSPPGG